MNKQSIADIPVITIDGPSASGKGTVAQRVAEQLGFHYLDSGALYRLIALAAKQQHIGWHDAEALAACAKTLEIAFKQNQILLNGIDVSEQIRTEEMGKSASEVAVHAELRSVLVDIQHQFRQSPGLVADGRDMGTVIFPSATLKIFLTASTETRAERRYKQLAGKNQPADYASILKDLQQRDERDKTRASAPLVMAADALLLETDHLNIEQAVDWILQKFSQKIKK